MQISSPGDAPDALATSAALPAPDASRSAEAALLELLHVAQREEAEVTLVMLGPRGALGDPKGWISRESQVGPKGVSRGLG